MGKNETKRYVQVSIHLEPEMLKALKKLAEKSQRTVSAQTRFLIGEVLKDESNGQS